MQAFSLFSVLFLALIVYHKMAFNAVISRLSAIYNHREQTLFKSKEQKIADARSEIEKTFQSRISESHLSD